jgi:glucokinase
LALVFQLSSFARPAKLLPAQKELRLKTIVLADIGGTNIRFATWTADGRTLARESWLTAIYENAPAAFAAYAELTGARPDAVAICAAGPLIRGRIKLTNCPWELDQDVLSKVLGAPVTLMNDFAALANAVPALTVDDVASIGGGPADPTAPKLILGPGTGLGVASVIPEGQGQWRVLSGEGGHVALAPGNARELALLYQLQQMLGYVSAERVLSGPGLENLMLAIAAVDGLPLRDRPQADEIERRAAKGDPVAAEAMELFAGWLGAVAGDAALTLGARGGVYIAGGIVPRWGVRFDAGLARRRFEAKGPMRDYMRAIPLFTVTAQDLAFRGLARIASG